MEIANNIDLGKYWNQAIDYNSYIDDIEKEIEKKDSFFNYYTLNLQRMQRLKKKLKLDEIQLKAIQNINKKVDILVITEGWCGDAAQIVPVLNKMCSATDKLSIRFIYRDQHEELINGYLTNGGKSIPIVIGIDPDNHIEIFRWGPRPEFGNELLKKFKNGDMSKEFFQLDLQKAYNKDKGKAIIEEILNKIK